MRRFIGRIDGTRLRRRHDLIALIFGWLIGVAASSGVISRLLAFYPPILG